jgi:hypothetical protein
MKEYSSAAEVFFLGSIFGLYLFWFLNPEIMFLATCIYALLFLSFGLKYSVGKPFLIGLIISLSYLTFYKDVYTYTRFLWRFFDYPLLPLLAWPIALTLLGYYMTMFFDATPMDKVWVKVAISYLVYIAMLVFLEYTAYHYHQIRLVSNYASLPLIDCMHTPLCMKVVYFVNGFIFFTVYFYLEDPHLRSQSTF